ncbi:ribonuclease J [Ethanoligenens harbinense]|uniref:Ribonuclease J n=1 Tax=Ethanoligenens harbinense (strain DSM 18485 / JCM 12961 / CGMCC 1.5033 / YUAN-3) TaxID=663278 RepID=E6U4R4_ETHHY|nr:ribonuclease J [Ethanoligenens harbinense]ADU27799.1 RNA-metabolising metallo-beta-lactamase [Ethanoligenens harbinense YUAN-3]AVQ96822.1 ribonuclease J [Ethanoligenens harbinense YUAN-3]AYF39484.1 ribonuclease J [Ethanoligenens harbinense]AYF42309.1 ribonuclease J [Ethanoligenens harbinense]QCN93063.1 ribonuclease J [Ethanoligenens harbinense]
MTTNNPATPATPERPGQPSAAAAKASAPRRQNPRPYHRGRRKPTVKPGLPLRIVSLGGLNEIGKNITAYECGDDIVIVDCGLAFPDSDMLGVDLVIPDVTWLVKNKDRIRGVVLTHGHEDHIGALPYVLKQVNMPLYGTELTLALVEGKLKEHGLTGKVKLHVVKPGDTVKLGCMTVEFINVNHSIAGSVALAINTPGGLFVQTGDFKIDCTPIHGEMIDLARFGELGKEGVTGLLMDSTNAERPGYTLSERKVGEALNTLFAKAEGKRLIIATFASNVHRVQQIVDYAQKYGRHVAVSGRSMVNVCGIAAELGYLRVPEGLVVDIDEIDRFPKEKMVIVTTGSQGEAMSALYRMAYSDHRKVVVGPDDFVIISANPIPGNEKTVDRVVNELMRLGAEVVYEEVHVSGHARQEELKIIMSLCKPTYFIPVHGEYKHLMKNASLARSIGIPDKNIIITDIGKVMEFDKGNFKFVGTVPAGRVLVDGTGVGDVGSIVLRDRKHLAQDGLIVVVATIDGASGALVAGPDIVSRGFVYVRESESLMEQTRLTARDVLMDCADAHVTEWGTIKSRVKDALSKLLYERTKRSPMILPVIMEV